MKRKNLVSDQQIYPALWITLALLAAGYWIWRDLLGSPSLRGCWFYRNFHIYCPGCGGTRALMALFQGHVIQSLYYHPAVPFAAISVTLYLLSQTLWRIRGRRGWVLHYSNRWLWALLAMLLGNCAVRNLLWFQFAIPI